MGHICDQGNKADRDAMLQKINDKHGRLDVLIPNAACVTHAGDQLQIEEEAYD